MTLLKKRIFIICMLIATLLSAIICGLKLIEKDIRLHIAAMNGNIDLVDELLSKGHTINELSLFLKHTPITFVSIKPNCKTIKALIDRGADVNAKDKDGYSVLIKISKNVLDPDEQICSARELLNDGANPLTQANNKITALEVAASTCAKADYIKLLLDSGAQKHTPALLRLLKSSDDKTIKHLINTFVEATEGKNKKQISLHFKNNCTGENLQKSFDLLVQAGADIDFLSSTNQLSPTLTLLAKRMLLDSRANRPVFKQVLSSPSFNN